MPTLNLHSSKVLFKIGGAAAAVGLLACIVFSSPANATTFTATELQAGASFTIGNLTFSDFDFTASSVSPDLITIDTVDSPLLPGFLVNGNGNWTVQGDNSGAILVPHFLTFTYEVTTDNPQPMIGGAGLYATSYTMENGTRVALGLTDGGAVDLEVLIVEPFGLPITNADNAADSVNLNPRLASLMLSSTMVLGVEGLIGPQGPGELNSYAMLFPVSVPEPGTALLMGLGLAGLVAFGRPRR